MRILVITYSLPAPPSSGVRVRDLNLLQRLARHHEVHLLSLLEPGQQLRDAKGYLDDCAHLDGVAAANSPVSLVRAAGTALVKGRPLATAPYYRDALARKITELSRLNDYDIVQIEHSYMAPYIDALDPGFEGSRVISLHNIGQFQYASMARTASARERPVAALKSWMMRGWEKAAIAGFDHAIVVSDDDLARLRRIGCELPATVIPNGVDTRRLQPLPSPGGEDLVFVGTMGYLPNREAVRWMVHEILPLIRQQRPACRLHVVGSGGRKHLGDLQRDGMVEITGTVEDIMPWYRSSRVAVVPLLSGGGTRLKILEAMALGLPVVSTRLGCEGIHAQAGDEVMLADSPRAFANAVIRLLEDHELHSRLARNARQRVESDYDWDLLSGRLLQEYARLVDKSAQ